MYNPPRILKLDDHDGDIQEACLQGLDGRRSKGIAAPLARKNSSRRDLQAAQAEPEHDSRKSLPTQALGWTSRRSENETGLITAP
jgi:hypothetical protein